MDDPVQVAVIGASATLLNSAIAALGYRYLRRRTGAIEYAVKNDHAKPLREDMDDKHDDILGLLVRQHRETQRDIGGIREEIRALRRTDERTNERIDEIEHTYDPRRDRDEQQRTRSRHRDT